LAMNIKMSNHRRRIPVAVPWLSFSRRRRLFV
jgi:hypothetical protein